jgi:hypothetical protein
MAMAAASRSRVCPLRHLNPDMDRRRHPGMCDACYHGAWGSGNWGTGFRRSRTWKRFQVRVASATRG